MLYSFTLLVSFLLKLKLSSPLYCLRSRQLLTNNNPDLIDLHMGKEFTDHFTSLSSYYEFLLSSFSLGGI